MKKNRIVWTLLALSALAGAYLGYNQSASSNSPAPGMAPPLVINVNSTADILAPPPGVVTLRSAIVAANADPGADPVIINLTVPGTYNLTLANATQENAAATGDLDITTTLHSVTIAGGGSSGPGATIIDASGLSVGNSRDRAFHITASGVTVTFQDLIIQHGHAADDGTSGVSTDPEAQNTHRAGGGILNNGGSVTLDNVIVRLCHALGKGDTVINAHTTLDALGGGIASLTPTGNVIITDSTLMLNTASGGDGGNFNNGEGSIAKGGSIYFAGGTLNVSASRIAASIASGGNGGSQDQNGQTNGGFGGLAQGGGVWVGGGTVTIDNTTFEDTEAIGGNSGTGGNGVNPAGSADGGGLYSLGNVTVTNSTFNFARADGGDGGDAFGTTCLGGHSAGDGGGARGGAIFADGGTMIINTATFANNFATGGDGGDGGQTDGGLNCGNHGAGGLAFGGAIANNAATLNIKHATISLNSAQAGNTGVNQGGANKPPRLVAEGAGGGVRVGPAGATFENTIVAANTAANGPGDATGAPTPGPNVDGTVTSNGHNLLGVATDATGFTGPGDQTGANPLLAALADNGGPTQTMALTPGSPAIDAGVAAGASFDQRGRPRTFDDPGVVNAATSDGTDIGAFELQPLCTLTCPDDLSVSNDPDQCGAVVNFTTPSGAGCGTVTCVPSPGAFFPVGDTTVTCTSSVGPTCSFVVTVNDTQAPTIIVNGQPIILWPPNHKYKTVKIADLIASVSDNCDPSVGIAGAVITKVTSDEPENGGGDGDTTNDIVIAANCKSVKLRAERSGNGNGRVYTITVQIEDSSGNVATATAKVTVPKSQNGAPAVDDGPQYTVLGGCP